MRSSYPDNSRSRQRSQGRDYEDQGRERDSWRDERRFESDWNQYGADRSFNQDYDEFEDRDRQWNQGRGGLYRGSQDMGPGRRSGRAWDESDRGGYQRQFGGQASQDFDDFEDENQGYYGSPQRSSRSAGHGFGSARGTYQRHGQARFGGGAYGSGARAQGGRGTQWGSAEGYGSSLEGFGQSQRGRDWDQAGSQQFSGGGYGGQWREQQRRPQTPKGYTRSDERIREDVCEQLAQCQFDVSNVSVDVKQGKVTLDGTVHERRVKHQIEDIADNCMGVKDVDNKLRIQREGESSGLGESDSTSRSRREH